MTSGKTNVLSSRETSCKTCSISLIPKREDLQYFRDSVTETQTDSKTQLCKGINALFTFDSILFLSSNCTSNSSTQISHLEEIVNEKSSTIKDLEEKLNRQKDYENIKRELR